jgi:hypothetical protein
MVDIKIETKRVLGVLTKQELTTVRDNLQRFQDVIGKRIVVDGRQVRCTLIGWRIPGTSFFGWTPCNCCVAFRLLIDDEPVPFRFHGWTYSDYCGGFSFGLSTAAACDIRWEPER